MTHVEVTTRYATTVETLPEAWAFVMERVDQVGPRPSIAIRPYTVISIGDALSGRAGEESPAEAFEVVVSGMVEEASATDESRGAR